MKELSTKKPLVIGVMGIPGAGKSRFAGEFSTMFGAPVIDKSRLARDIFGVTKVNKTYHDGLDRAFWTLVGEELKSKRAFLVDGNLNTNANRAQLRAAAKKAGYDVLLIWVQTSEAVAESRVVTNKRDARYSEADFTKLRTVDAPGPRDDYIVVSGQHTFASQARPILKRIAGDGDRGSLTPPPRDATRPRRNIFIR